ERPAAEQERQLGVRGAVEGAGGTLCASPSADRAELGRRRADDDLLAAPAQVDVAIGPHVARVRRRAQLADQAELLQPRFELAAEDVPVDPLDGSERGLDRRPLP